MEGLTGLKLYALSTSLQMEGLTKYTSWNLKTTKLLDYVPIGVCEVIRSNMVIKKKNQNF